MDFSYSSDQQLLKDSIERFVRDDYGFDARHKILASEDGFSRAHWATFAELGLLGLPFAEDEGGFAGTPTETMIVMEAFGRGLVVEPYLATVVLAGSVLRFAAPPAQRAGLLPGIVSGKRILTLAFGERRARYTLSHVETKAEAKGSGWVLDGTKSVVLHAPAADQILVTARTRGTARDPDGISLFLVDREQAGVSLQPYPTFDGARAGEVVLERAEVAGDRLVGPLHGGHDALERAIDVAAAAVAAEAVGAMEALFEQTRDYLNTREQFGVKIGSFQVLQHALADMFTELEQSRSMAIVAAVHAEDGDARARRRAVSAAKAQIGKSGRFIGETAVQLHGGMGMTDEMKVGHYFKRLTAIDRLFGDRDHHLARFATA